MRRILAGLLVLVVGIAGSSLVVQSQPPGSRGQGNQPPGGGRGPGSGGRGGFPQPPPPPVLAALDTNKDGEISAKELQNAPAALRTLDKNQDGEVAGTELRPQGGPGGSARGGFGPGGFGPGGFGPGGGPGRGGFNSGGSGERLAPTELPFRDGVAAIPDLATYHKLAYRGEDLRADTFLIDLEFVKFTLDGASTEKRQLYFINTKTHRAHHQFAQAAGLARRGSDQMKGVLVYRPMLNSPNGEPGLFTFEFEPFDSYEHSMVRLCLDELLKKMPMLDGRIGYYPRGSRALARYDADRDLYKRAGPPVYLDEDLSNTEIGYLPLNLGRTFGRLRVMKIDERPNSRDVVLYKTLPNEMPRVAGIITEVRQTPLSHVNLRAIQDHVPNAFITKAAEDASIKPLIDKYVSYAVTLDGYDLREATTAEVDAHFAALRPREKQVPRRDLAAKKIRPLNDIRFKDSTSVGVKAANVATMRTFGFPDETVPNGFAIPFYLYDEFMKHNDFYAHARALLDNPEFREDRDTQEAKLKEFRQLIQKGRMPDWMMQSLAELQQAFPQGTPLRCRSSTNNEDLPGFSGAGLYGSRTHRPDEGHLSTTIKQVYATLWTFRAFDEREFYRVDHFETAMGVLVHPNYQGESANGVAVTTDILYQTYGNYYVNTQVGEDLVTNPDEESVPEEILLDWWKSTNVKVMRTSNRAPEGKPLLSAAHLKQLRSHLSDVHAKFARLYGTTLEDENFAMEIEFKITKRGRLVIKQARPWVFAPPVPEPSVLPRKQAASEEPAR